MSKHYIVMDLEWNQPVSFQSAAFKQIGDQLLFEIIQIGAVKLDEKFEIVEEVNLLIRPTHYTRLHSYVKRMTKLTQQDLDDAPVFQDAMEKFIEFCGDDAVLLTWGADDVSVLKQNADCFQITKPLPETCNIQRYFAEVFDLGNSQKALKSAMEQLEIEVEENRFFHHAMHDAYYTARVLQKLPNPEKVLKHVEKPRKLTRSSHRRRFRITHTVPSVAAGLAHKDVVTPECPSCNKPTSLITELIPQAPGRYIAMSKCKRHGQLMVKVRFARLNPKQIGMNVSVTIASRQGRAYVHTKELQHQYRRKNGYQFPDPEDLSQATLSSMPFDET